MAYLGTHLAKLRPFIAPNVAEAIERAAAAAPAGALQLPDPPSEQPEQIKGVLRNYQVSWGAVLPCVLLGVQLLCSCCCCCGGSGSCSCVDMPTTDVCSEWMPLTAFALLAVQLTAGLSG